MVSLKVVTPVKTGVQKLCNQLKNWIPAFAGMTKNGVFRLFTRSSKLRNQMQGEEPPPDDCLVKCAALTPMFLPPIARVPSGARHEQTTVVR
jgi:hypothetical protein